MPNVKVKYSLGLTTLKQQSLKFRTGEKVRELLINAGKVISQQIIDVVTKISPQHEVVVAPVPGLDTIVENNRRRADQAPAASGGSAAIDETLSVSYEPGVVIFEQGDHSDEVFILVDGGVEILVNNVKVAEIKEKNTYFGELSILTGEPRSATVRTIAQSSFCVIPGARLEAAIQRNPSIGFKLATLLANRLKQTNQKAVAATEKAEKLEFRLKALGEDINVFLSQRKNPLIADLCRNLVLVEFHKDDGTMNLEELVK